MISETSTSAFATLEDTCDRCEVTSGIFRLDLYSISPPPLSRREPTDELCRYPKGRASVDNKRCDCSFPLSYFFQSLNLLLL